MKYEVNNIPEYLNAIPKDRVDVITEIMGIINEVAPEVNESYEYGMPFYKLKGEPLFAVASQKHFIAVYVTEHKIVEKYKSELGKVSMGKTCIRFNKPEKLNMDTLTKILIESYEKRLKNNVPHSAA